MAKGKQLIENKLFPSVSTYVNIRVHVHMIVTLTLTFLIGSQFNVGCNPSATLVVLTIDTIS